MIDLIKDREVLVVGLARSGMAAVEVLSEAGASKITVTDQKEPDRLRDELAALKRFPSANAVTGGNPPELVKESLSMIIKSPGVPPSLELFKRAAKMGVPVYSEIELAYPFIKATLVGVTGTNGKTTTTALIAAILEEARFDPVVSAGNIGNPLAGLAGRVNAQGVVVVELSSFQLEDIHHFRPAVAVFINFAEDHLDYHDSVDKYFQAKARILENQGKGDYAVLNAGDTKVASLENSCRGQLIWFDYKPVSQGVGLEEGWITIYRPGSEPQRICPRDEIALPGEHNLENSLAAAAAAWAAGADSRSIGSALRKFRAIEHRLEPVAVLDGVDYINDSKGTNPGATIKAMQSFPGRRKILIAGGKDKGGDFGELASVIKKELAFLVLLGETKDRIARIVEEAGFTAYQKVEILEDAVKTAHEKAESGDVVLFSPACASWDMFTDYEARGNLFKKLVRNLKASKQDRGNRNEEH